MWVLIWLHGAPDDDGPSNEVAQSPAGDAVSPVPLCAHASCPSFHGLWGLLCKKLSIMKPLAFCCCNALHSELGVVCFSLLHLQGNGAVQTIPISGNPMWLQLRGDRLGQREQSCFGICQARGGCQVYLPHNRGCSCGGLFCWWAGWTTGGALHWSRWALQWRSRWALECGGCFCSGVGWLFPRLCTGWSLAGSTAPGARRVLGFASCFEDGLRNCRQTAHGLCGSFLVEVAVDKDQAPPALWICGNCLQKLRAAPGAPFIPGFGLGPRAFLSEDTRLAFKALPWRPRCSGVCRKKSNRKRTTLFQGVSSG